MLHGALASSVLGEQSLGRFEHDHLVTSHIRLGWGAVEVARELVSAAPPSVDVAGFEGLIDYIETVSHAEYWMVGELHRIERSSEDQQLSRAMALAPGVLKGWTFVDLNSTRRADEYPFIVVEDIHVPASLESLTTRAHIPILNYVRRGLSPKSSADLFERSCAELLKKVPGMLVRTGDLTINVSDTDPGEIDVIATNSSGTRVLFLEAKGQFERDLIPTTQDSFRQGVDKLHRQLARRLAAFRSGRPIQQYGEPIPLRPEAEAVGIGITVHDYSGSLWRPSALGHPYAASSAHGVLTISDLALIVHLVRSDSEFFEYLSLREMLFANGAGVSCDEIDIVAIFLERGYATLNEQLSRGPLKKRMVFVPPRDAPSDLTSTIRTPTRDEARRLIADLPRVSGSPSSWPTS